MEGFLPALTDNVNLIAPNSPQPEAWGRGLWAIAGVKDVKD